MSDIAILIIIGMLAFVIGGIPALIFGWLQIREARQSAHKYIRGTREIYQEDRNFWAGVDQGRAEVIRMAFEDVPDGPFRDGLLSGVAESIRIEREVKGQGDE